MFKKFIASFIFLCNVYVFAAQPMQLNIPQKATVSPPVTQYRVVPKEAINPYENRYSTCIQNQCQFTCESRCVADEKGMTDCSKAYNDASCISQGQTSTCNCPD